MKQRAWAYALLLLVFLTAQSALGEANLPQKAFNVEGGIVSVRAGVMPNPEAPAPLPFGKLKYPTRYFVQPTNESPYPVWFEASWAFPANKKDKAAKSNIVSSPKIPLRGGYWFYSDKLGVIVDQAIVVEIRAYADEKRTKLVGSQTVELVFDQPSVDHFLANFPSSFKSYTPESRQAMVISGWHDLPAPRTDVPGSLADAELQRDIQLSIWKVDSTRRWTCEREVLSASTMDVDDSQLLSRLPGDAQDKAKLEVAEYKLSAERWTVRSCGEERVFEVLLSASLSGGTDIMVVETTEVYRPQTETSETLEN